MITISKKTEYGLLLVEYLSLRQNEKISLKQAALELGLPYRFLSQVSSDLVGGGLLTSKEGKNGGYVLNKGWGNTSMYQLLKMLGEDKHMVTCLGSNVCSRSPMCRARRVWGRLESIMTEELKKIKLGDL